MKERAKTAERAMREDANRGYAAALRAFRSGKFRKWGSTRPVECIALTGGMGAMHEMSAAIILADAMLSSLRVPWWKALFGVRPKPRNVLALVTDHKTAEDLVGEMRHAFHLLGADGMFNIVRSASGGVVSLVHVRFVGRHTVSLRFSVRIAGDGGFYGSGTAGLPPCAYKCVWIPRLGDIHERDYDRMMYEAERQKRVAYTASGSDGWFRLVLSFTPPPDRMAWQNVFAYHSSACEGRLSVHGDYRTVLDGKLPESFLAAAEECEKSEPKLYRSMYLGRI